MEDKGQELKVEQTLTPQPHGLKRGCAHKPVAELSDLKKKARHWEERCIQHCDLSNIPIYLSDSTRFLDGHKTTKYGSEIDSQKNNLYSAEDKVCPNKKHDLTFTDPDECSEYLDYLTSLQWMKRRWPHKSFRGISVKSAVLSRSFAMSNRNDNIILVPASKPTIRWTLLHELVHLLVPEPHAWHGRLFVRTLMAFVKWQYGKDMYQSFKDACREENVNYSPKRKAPWQ